MGETRADGTMPRRVLVVEDDEGLRLLILKALRKAGVDAEGAATGAAAIERVQAQPAGLTLLLDQRLPDMTGSDILAALSERALRVPFIVMTGQGDERLAVQMMKLGAADYLLKSVDLLDHLPGVVQRLFRELDTELRLDSAEEALRESEGKHRAVVEMASDGIGILQDGTLRFANPSLAALLGYETGEVEGMELANLVPRDALGLVLERYRKRVAGERLSPTFETVLLHKSGRSIVVEVNGSLTQHEGRPADLVIMRDITERKRAAAERDKLEALNWQLRKSESLGRMAGAVAHHFNNQLQVVLMNLEEARSATTLDPGLVEILSDAVQAARRASEVSSLMLTYLGRAGGKQELLDLAEVCRQNLPALQAAVSANVALEADLPSPGPVIKANANEQILQVLTNLATNAWEAYGDTRGAVRLTVSAVAATDVAAESRFPEDFLPQDTAYACLEVADTGCGIAPLDVGSIFDPFFSTKFTGRGLGLAVVLGIVRAHDGVVTVRSAPGSGSTFRVYLPVAEEAVPT